MDRVIMGPQDPATSTREAGRIPRPGDVLADKYRVERVLGVGGMGAVVAATHVELGQRVAIKLMLPELVSIPEFAARFLREAKASVALCSEHVARVFDVARLEDGSPYIVMELLEGMDLERVSRARGPLPVAEAIGYVLEACEAIGEAHGLGIVHRDLKPANLFLAQRRQGAPIVKVLDFGISKSTLHDAGPGDVLTATDTTLGSPHYMPPEQVRSTKDVDARADIWSLGVILHKLLTRRFPFEVASAGEYLMAIGGADPPVPLRARRPDAPPELEAVILRCLQRDVRLRFQSVGQLARALAPFAPPSAAALIERIASPIGEVGSLPSVETAALTPASTDAPTGSAWAPDAAAARPPRTRAVIISSALLAGAVLTIASVRWLSPAPQAASPAFSASLEPSAIAPAPGREVAIRLVIEPLQAVVQIDGAPTRDNPIKLPCDDRAHTLAVSASGYAPETRTVSASADAVVTISLRALPLVAPGTAKLPEPAKKGPAAPPKKSKGPLETNL